MKKRDFLFCAALGLLTIGQTLAQQLSPEQAKAKAEAFLSAKTGLRSACDLQLRFAVSDTTQLPEGATANEEILAGSLQIAWQGTTLCVQAPAPLQAYHIYNVKGSLVATGSASGHELRIDGSTWTAGVYVVAIETADGKTIVGKIRL